METAKIMQVCVTRCPFIYVCVGLGVLLQLGCVLTCSAKPQQIITSHGERIAELQADIAKLKELRATAEDLPTTTRKELMVTQCVCQTKCINSRGGGGNM